jgi:hypothetical protein
MFCHVTVTAPIMGHNVIFKLFWVQFWHIFSQLQITFEGGEVKASSWPSIMQNLIGCMAWFES